MRKNKYRWFAAIIVCALLLCGVTVSSGSSSMVYLMSVNDTVKPELTTNNMPMLFADDLYIPYTMLSSRETGINLGVRAQYNASQGVLTVSDESTTVVFDTKKNTAASSRGDVVPVRAVVRNSMVYIPMIWLCGYFPDIDCSLSGTPYGVLVRLTNKDVVLTDKEFVDAADNLLRGSYQRYQKSLTEATPTPTLTPTPTVNPTPSQSQAPTPKPMVYLGLHWGDHMAEAADAVEAAGQRALFLIPSHVLVAEDDLIRRLVGRGHQIGLVLTGEDEDTCLAQLRQGRQLLADIARTTTMIVCADELSRGERSALQEAGCVCWNATLYADGLNPSGVLTRLEGTDANYVEITCDSTGVQLVKNLLGQLTGDNYRLRQAAAPALQ